MAATMGGGRTAGATWGSRRASRRAGNMLSCNNPCILSYCLSRAAPSSSPRGQGSPATHVAASAGPLPHSQAVQAAQPDPLTVTVRLARARAALTSQAGHSATSGQSLTAQQPSQEGVQWFSLDTLAQPLVDSLSPQVELPPQSSLSVSLDQLSTQYIDETLLSALQATNVNSINKGDYRQVVLLGDGGDTRPYRLPWPEGTIIFLVAPREAHERCNEVVKAAGARVPRGCLLRRVAFDLRHHQDSTGLTSSTQAADGEGAVLGLALTSALEAAGYQGTRLSVWALQGFTGSGMSGSVMRQLLVDITNSAAFNSLLLGELPPLLTRKEAENLLAECGLLSTVLGYDSEAVSGGRGVHFEEEEELQRSGDPLAGAHVLHQDASTLMAPLVARGSSQPSAAESTPGVSERRQRWLFTSQQLRLSLAEMGVYEAHVAANDIDEDYFDNIS